MRRLNLYITDEQHRQLNRLKEITEISISEHIRRALERYLAMFSITENTKRE